MRSTNTFIYTATTNEMCIQSDSYLRFAAEPVNTLNKVLGSVVVSSKWYVPAPKGINSSIEKHKIKTFFKAWSIPLPK